MNEFEQVNDATSQKIKELQEMALQGRGSLMAIIRKNIKNWERNLKPVCEAVGKSYIEAIAEILEVGGYKVERTKLTTYISRARKGE